MRTAFNVKDRSTTTTFVSLNVAGGPKTTSISLARRFEEWNADVVLLSEVPGSCDLFEKLRDRFPHQRVNATVGRQRGAAVFTRLSTRDHEVPPALLPRVAVANINGTIVVSMYAPVEWNQKSDFRPFWKETNEFLRSLAAERVVVMGDLNIGLSTHDNECEA